MAHIIKPIIYDAQNLLLRYEQAIDGSLYFSLRDTQGKLSMNNIMTASIDQGKASIEINELFPSLYCALVEARVIDGRILSKETNGEKMYLTFALHGEVTALLWRRLEQVCYWD